MVQDEKENFLKENYLFKQGLVQQEKDDEVETRVATIEFATSTNLLKTWKSRQR